MSNKVASWVYQYSKVDNAVDACIAVAMADEAFDNGYLSGAEYGAIEHIRRKTRARNRKTVMRTIAHLEELGELLVRRPADRRRLARPGRHNEYVFLMGRDPLAVARSRGWESDPNGNRSPTGTYPSGDATEGVLSPSDQKTAIDRADDIAGPLLGHEAVPSASTNDQPAVAVDGVPPPSEEGSPSGTYPPGTGPGPVRDRFRVERDSEHSPCTPRPKEPAGRAREAESVDNDPLAELAGALSAAGHSVRWDLTPAQAERLLEHLARWPSIAAGLDAFTAAAAAGVRAHGLPRSARAWIPVWLELVPPKPRSVQLPPAPCPKPEHSGEPIGADGTCVLCKADARVGDRP